VRVIFAGTLFVLAAVGQNAPPQLSGEQFQAIVGFQQSGASGSDSSQKFFLDFYVSRPVPGLFRVTTQDGEPWVRWWGDVRVGSAPRSINSAISVASLTSNVASLKFNEVAQAAEFLTGLDMRLGYICCLRQRFLLSFTTAFGASGSLTANPPVSNATVFQNPVESPIFADFVRTYPAAANPAYTNMFRFHHRSLTDTRRSISEDSG